MRLSFYLYVRMSLHFMTCVHVSIRLELPKGKDMSASLFECSAELELQEMNRQNQVDT